MKHDPTSAEFFEEKYRGHADPWNFAGSPYEQHRYEVTFANLKDRRYGAAFEPGCSIGELTARLATICQSVHAMDISPTAVQQARSRCRDLANVEITCGALPHFLPPGPLDLIVLSEIGYYLREEQLAGLGATLADLLAPQGVLLAVHWLGHSEDHVLTGDRVHEILGGIGSLQHQHGERHPGFRLDRWVLA